MFFFSSRRRHTRLQGDWSSDVCSSDLELADDHERSQARVDRGRNSREACTATGEDRENEDGGGREGDAGGVGDRVPQDLTVEGGREIHRTQEDLEAEEQEARTQRDAHET